jgi:hypothetical protein
MAYFVNGSPVNIGPDQYDRSGTQKNWAILGVLGLLFNSGAGDRIRCNPL